MTDLDNVIRTTEEEIEVIDLEIARIDEILAGQTEPTLTLPDNIESMTTLDRGELENVINSAYTSSHKTWTEQVTYWNAKKEQLLQRKTELAAE